MIKFLLSLCYFFQRKSKNGEIEDDKDFIFINEVRITMEKIFKEEMVLEFYNL